MFQGSIQCTIRFCTSSLEHLTVSDNPNNNEYFIFGLSRVGRQGILIFGNGSLGLDVKHLGDSAFRRSRGDSDRRVVMTFDTEPVDSQTSPRTPVGGEDILLVPSVQSSRKGASWTSPESSVISQVSSSHPRCRNASAQSLSYRQACTLQVL